MKVQFLKDRLVLTSKVFNNEHSRLKNLLIENGFYGIAECPLAKKVTLEYPLFTNKEEAKIIYRQVQKTIDLI